MTSLNLPFISNISSCYFNINTAATFINNIIIVNSDGPNMNSNCLLDISINFSAIYGVRLLVKFVMDFVVPLCRYPSDSEVSRQRKVNQRFQKVKQFSDVQDNCNDHVNDNDNGDADNGVGQDGEVLYNNNNADVDPRERGDRGGSVDGYKDITGYENYESRPFSSSTSTFSPSPSPLPSTPPTPFTSPFPRGHPQRGRGNNNAMDEDQYKDPFALSLSSFAAPSSSASPYPSSPSSSGNHSTSLRQSRLRQQQSSSRVLEVTGGNRRTASVRSSINNSINDRRERGEGGSIREAEMSYPNINHSNSNINNNSNNRSFRNKKDKKDDGNRFEEEEKEEKEEKEEVVVESETDNVMLTLVEEEFSKPLYMTQYYWNESISDLMIDLLFMTLFSSVLPASVPAGFGMMLFTVVGFGWKMLYHYRRPLPVEIYSIGQWNKILHICCQLVIVTNAAMVCFVLPFFNSWIFSNQLLLFMGFYVVFYLLQFYFAWSFPKDEKSKFSSIQQQRSLFAERKLIDKISDVESTAIDML